MEYIEALNIYKEILNGNLSNKDNLNKYMIVLLSKMENDTINYNEQNLLDNYINYLRESDVND